LTKESELTNDVLPAGSLVIMSPWIVQRHESVWSEPERFDPQRFVGVDARGQAGYLPFGLGPRICVGRDFALTEATVVLSVLAREFRFELLDSAPITPLASVTMRPPDGLRVKVSRR
jgi:cytochrome P450